MIMSNLALAAAILVSASSSALLFVHAAEECVTPKRLICHPTTTPPTLDGDLSDWSHHADDAVAVNHAGAEAIGHADAAVTSTLSGAMGGPAYQGGDLTMRCTYDASRIYFAFEVPGAYRYDSTDDHRCASISTMFQMGEDATYFMMGGCPHVSMGTECDAVPADGGCDDYKVDVGGHWELKTTQMGVEYGPNSDTGNDLIANKDDEYAVSSYCRFDDDDSLAGNEWAAAWSHTNPPSMAGGEDYTNASAYSPTVNPGDKYIFEMSRLLRTPSTTTDAQLEAGQTIGFGVAYWDPNFSEGPGWNAASHFVTGCSKNWIDLVLLTEDMSLDDLDAMDGPTAGTEDESSAGTEDESTMSSSSTENESTTSSGSIGNSLSAAGAVALVLYTAALL